MNYKKTISFESVRRTCARSNLIHQSAWHLSKRAILCCALGITFQFTVQIESHAVNKCMDGEKVSYQDDPCKIEPETSADARTRKERNEVLHRKLDRLAEQGNGMIQRRTPSAPAVPVPAQDSKNELYVGKPRESDRARTERMQSDAKRITERKNAESVALLTRMAESGKQTCRGRMTEYPMIGMSDETFRECTSHARFGEATQIVISEEKGIPIKLYVFPTQRAQKVYVIAGVITSIKP